MSKLKKNDFRSLTISAQAALREVAFRAIDSGKTRKEVAELWSQQYRIMEN